MGEDALTASRAALAAKAQGKYLEFHRALLASRWKSHEQKAVTVAIVVGSALRVPGKFVAAHRALFREGARFPEKRWVRIAASVGLDTDRLKEDMKAPEIDAIIERNLALAESLGIRSTPALVVGKEMRIGPTSFNALKQLVAQARS